MATRNGLMRAGWMAAILGVAVALAGCNSVREATGVAKLPPDEFTVLTKAPLIIPPDYNLRPPQPGVASRNEVDVDDQARAALFPQNAAAAAAALGTAYSDGEKLLLGKANALTVDPNVRRSVSTDVGLEDQGPAFAQRVLFSGAGPAPAAPNAAAPAANAAPAPNGMPSAATGAPPPPTAAATP